MLDPGERGLRTGFRDFFRGRGGRIGRSLAVAGRVPTAGTETGRYFGRRGRVGGLRWGQSPNATFRAVDYGGDRVPPLRWSLPGGRGSGSYGRHGDRPLLWASGPGWQATLGTEPQRYISGGGRVDRGDAVGEAQRKTGPAGGSGRGR